MTIGGTLNLECVVREEQPNEIWWWLNGTKLDLEYHRGGVLIETIRQKKSSTSKLSVVDFNHADAGLYECRAEKIGHFQAQPIRSSVSVMVVDPTKPPPPFSDDYDDDQAHQAGAENLSCLSITLLLSTMIIFI